MRSTRRAYLTVTVGALTLDTAGCLDSRSGRSGDDTVAAIGCEVPERDTVSPLPTPVIGPENTSAVTDVWEDFVCPYCVTFTIDIVPQLQSECVSEGVIRYRHHDLPIPADE